jgi:hypothetical protein
MDEEDLQVFTLATIGSHLDDTLAYMRNLQTQHEQRCVTHHTCT